MLVEIDGRHQYQYADHRSVEGITQDEDIYKASIFEILRPSKPGSQLESLVTSPDSTHLVNIAQRRITDLFSRREGSPSIFFESGIFYMWTWLAYLLTTILGTRCQNSSELIKEITFKNDDTVDGGRWLVRLDNVNNLVSDNSSSIRRHFSEPKNKIVS